MTLIPLVVDPYIAELRKTGQLEPRFLSNLAKVNSNGFRTETEEQSKVLWEAARMFRYVEPQSREIALDTLLPNIPRLHRSAGDPRYTLERLLHLPTQSDIERCLTVGEEPVREWVEDKDEGKYLSVGGWIGEYLEYSKHNQCNVAFHFWSIITMVGAICQRKVYYDMGQFNVYLNTYTILTGDSASGKSIARSNAMDLLRRFNRRMEERDPDGPDNVIVLPNESTPQYIIDALDNLPYSRINNEGREEIGERDAVGLLDLDELSTFLNKGAYGVEIKVPMLVRMYDANVYDKGTATDGKKELHNCALSILGLAAPEWFKESITPAVRKGGLLDRIMFIHRGESRRRYTLPLDPQGSPGPPRT